MAHTQIHRMKGRAVTDVIYMEEYQEERNDNKMKAKIQYGVFLIERST